MIRYTKIIVDQNLENQTVYTFLKSKGFSESYLKKLRKCKQNVLVNNKPSIVKCLVFKGDVLQVNQNPQTTKTSVKPVNKPLDIVFEDDYILIVNKPSGLSSMANRAHYDNNLAGQIVNYYSGKIDNFVLRIVNRLDKDTQGLIMVAKTALVYKSLLTSAKKVYHAVLNGNITSKMEIHSPIKNLIENGRINIKRVTSPDGKPASTFITPIKQFKNHTLCQIEIVHGRTHQIRVHASSVGHALEGDYIYGKESNLIPHTALVCKQLSFYHPVKQQTMFFEASYGKRFLTLLETLEKESLTNSQNK